MLADTVVSITSISCAAKMNAPQYKLVYRPIYLS